MLASVLNSERAVAVSVYVVRAFVKLRETLGSHKKLVKKLEKIEKKLQAHDKQISVLIYHLIPPPGAGQKEPFGFRSKKKK